MDTCYTWWRHQMETFSALLAFCAGNSPVTGEFPAQRSVTRGFDVFFDLHLNKRLSKHSWSWWFETPSGILWRHCNDLRVVSKDIFLVPYHNPKYPHICMYFQNVRTDPTNPFTMTSSNGNIFCVINPLLGEFTGQWLIPLRKASGTELWLFCLWSAPEQTVVQTMETS